FMEYRGKKELAPPSIKIPWGKKVYYHPLPFPGLKRKVMEGAPLAPLKPRMEIGPATLVLPELVSPFARYVPARYARIETLPFMEYRGKKELAPPSIKIPRGKKVYYPGLRKESPLPYLHLSVSLAPHDSFSYQLDYGRQKERFTGFLSAGSVSIPHWVKYEPEDLNLGKHEETIASELIWGSLTNRTLALNLERWEKKIDFPNERERKKNEIEIGANLRQEWKTSVFTIDGRANRSALKDSEVDEKDIALGNGLELRLKKIPLDIGVSVDYSSFSEKTQTHLWLEDDTITFKRMEELTLGLGGGMKAITGSGSQFLPSLKLAYQINPRLQLSVGGKRHFYLAKFSDLYLPQDYVEINEDLDPVKIWHYEIKLEYKLPPLANLSLMGFYKEGKDTIWNWNNVNSLARPEIREMNVSGGRLNFSLHFGEAFEQGLSYTFQKAENAQDESKVIPHYPQNEGDLWLIGRTNGWAVELGARYIGKRYSEETSEEKLDSGWIERFRISKKMGEAIECFAQLELNDYDLWKNYRLSKEKLSLGFKAKLY
ncbi:MAG: TonB-dependent receptor domain-containing protein, partial [bacterium]